MPTQAPVRIKPGTGTLIVDLGGNQIVVLDLATFLNALHGEIVAFQPHPPFPTADAWQDMIGTALRKARKRDPRPAA